MTAPIPQPGILDISLYVPGASGAGGPGKPVKLSSNESALGASPKAIAAYQELSASLHLYPDGGAVALRNAIGAAHGLDPKRIICGSGSDEIINLIAAAYLGPGTEALMTTQSFLVFRIAAMARGATPVLATERELTTDVDALLTAITDRTRVVFLANPNNPTGTYIPFDEVRRLHRGMPPHVLLVLDGAYAEYVRAEDFSAGFELADSAENVIVTRTFSKVYGLAGLRLGWGYGPAAMIDVFNRIRPPFNVSAPASAAGIAALGDPAHVEAALAHNDRWLPWLTRELTALGLTLTPSVGNFVLARFHDRVNAASADRFLQSRSIYVRPVAAYGISNSLRMTAGTGHENRALVAALKDFLQAKDQAA